MSHDHYISATWPTWNTKWSLNVRNLEFHTKFHKIIKFQVPKVLHKMPCCHEMSGTWNCTWNVICFLNVKYLVFSTILYLKFYLKYHISFTHEIKSSFGIITPFQPQITATRNSVFVQCDNLLVLFYSFSCYLISHM